MGVWGENKGNRIIIDTVSRLILNYYLDISIFKEILLEMFPNFINYEPRSNNNFKNGINMKEVTSRYRTVKLEETND